MSQLREHRAFDIDGFTVYTLRFATLDENGEVVITSAPPDFDIDKEVIICSWCRQGKGFGLLSEFQKLEKFCVTLQC